MTQQRNALLPDFDFEMNKNHTAKKCILRYRFWNKSKSQECFIPLNFCFLVPVVLEGSMIPKWGKNCWNICPAPILGSVQGQAGAPWAVEAAPAMAGPKSLHGFGITRECRDQHRNCLCHGSTTLPMEGFFQGIQNNWSCQHWSPRPPAHPAFGRIFPWNSEDSATTGSADPAPWCPELGGCRERIPWDFTHGRGEGLALGLKDGVLMAFLGDCSKPGVLGVLLSHPIPPLTAPAQNLSANPAFCG